MKTKCEKPRFKLQLIILWLYFTTSVTLAATCFINSQQNQGKILWWKVYFSETKSPSGTWSGTLLHEDQILLISHDFVKTTNLDYSSKAEVNLPPWRSRLEKAIFSQEALLPLWFGHQLEEGKVPQTPQESRDNCPGISHLSLLPSQDRAVSIIVINQRWSFQNRNLSNAMCSLTCNGSDDAHHIDIYFQGHMPQTVPKCVTWNI